MHERGVCRISGDEKDAWGWFELRTKLVSNYVLLNRANYHFFIACVLRESRPTCTPENIFTGEASGYTLITVHDDRLGQGKIQAL